ncbi:MAG: thiamine-phosphate kinase [Campylobacterales bacterium]|nr:thiamine-phosphate kinase [Campylobacterales bacterium]
MNKEDFFINEFVKNNKQDRFIGDDAAVIGKDVYSMDAFFENVHFKREWFSLKQIAAKAMLVNISDAIVMNAIPKYALLSVAIPKSFSFNDLEELASGFKKVAKKYNIKIIGGDTIANEKLDISITIISHTENAIYRTGTKLNDLVCYTGSLGTCKEDLETLQNGGKVSSKSKFIKPKLRAEFFYEIAPYINSALDISDGLFFELERLSKANKIDFEFLYNIPKEQACSGEEYEILFTYSQTNEKIIKKIAKKHKINLNTFAKAVEGEFKCLCSKHHF